MQVAQLIEIHLGFIPALYDLSHWTLHNCSFRAPLKPNYLKNYRSDEKHFPYTVVQLLKTCILRGGGPGSDFFWIVNFEI